MSYKTHEILKPKLNEIMEQFVENYFSEENHFGIFEFHSVGQFKNRYEVLIHKIIHTDNMLDRQDFLPIVELNISHNIPYIMVFNELNFIKSILIHHLLDVRMMDEVIFLCELFEHLLGNIAKMYLERYIQALQSRNEIRLISLSSLDKCLIHYYSAHIQWLNHLSMAMSNRDNSQMPELDNCKCIFGKWLIGDAKQIIANNSKYKEISNLHQTLHFVASKIAHMIDKNDCNWHAGMTYLEKAEFISLEIGAELSMIDNKMIMTQAKKDPLTNVLNRTMLDKLFCDQYDLALATQQTFVLAMCDIDNFKTVNDTYGHSQGDKILILFTQILKQKVRGSDLIFRYGGDEFIIIFPASIKESVRKLLDNIRVEFQNSLTEIHSMENNITVSIGTIQITPENSELNEQVSFNNFLEQVDKKLYKAKSHGRNRVE